jgi:hypothetical protein
LKKGGVCGKMATSPPSALKDFLQLTSTLIPCPNPRGCIILVFLGDRKLWI